MSIHRLSYRSISPSAIHLAILVFALLAIASQCASLHAQANEWTWVAGPNTPPFQSGFQPPVYGQRGVPAPGNVPGGRSDSASWTDSSGDWWLFGGQGASSVDLWKFNPSTKLWAWMGGGGGQYCPDLCTQNGQYGTKGVAAAGVYPGGRWGAASWTDTSGRFWLFGGWGYDYAPQSEASLLNDIWMFDPATALWTWIGGAVTPVPATYGTKGKPDPANIPGARYWSLTWTDNSGNFWLYGGTGSGQAPYLSDLWMFNPNTLQWTWVGGSSTGDELGAPPVAGTLGVPSAGNSPGARELSATWTDQSGNLWLFSGQIYHNDLWEFNPASNQWAWMGGSIAPTCEPNGNAGYACTDDPVFGTLGQPSAQSIPGARLGSFTWTDRAGNFWLFGGQKSLSGTSLDDMWEFNPSTNQWAWMGGDSRPTCRSLTNECWEVAVYGIQGTPAAGNVPGGREGGRSWVDHAGNFWLFGGSVGQPAPRPRAFVGYNDVWEFIPSTSALPPAATPLFDPPIEAYDPPQLVTISNGMSPVSFYYTTDGTTPTHSSTLYTGPFVLSVSETIQAIATAPGYLDSGVGSIAYALPTDKPVFSIPGGTYSSVQTLTISDGTPGAVIYYSINSTASTVYTGPITISETESVAATALAPGSTRSLETVATFVIALPPSAPTFTLSVSQESLSVNSGGQGTATVTVTPQNGFHSAVSFTCSGQPAGVMCGFNPASVTPASNAVTTQLTFTASASAAAERPGRLPLLPELAMVGLIGTLGWRRRQKWGRWIAIAAAICALGWIFACGGGGGGGSSSLPPVTHTQSTVTVTATSGTLQKTTTIALTLN